MNITHGITQDGRGWSRWTVNGMIHATAAYWTDTNRVASELRFKDVQP